MADDIRLEPVTAKSYDEEAARISLDSVVSSVADEAKALPFGKMSWRQRWDDLQGMCFVLVAENCGAGMAATARLLELGDHPMTVLQIMFVRFSITLVLSSIYGWWHAIPDFPLGKREIRFLLTLRGIGGFIGVFGFYYAIQYMAISEALVLGFLMPLFTAYSCSFFLNQVFERRQLYAGLISFAGVILIARPERVWFSSGKEQGAETGPAVSPVQHLIAVAAILISNLGGTMAMTAIRVIGSRAHPLISVNYYAIMSTLVSAAVLLLPIFPGAFRMPHDARQWTLMVGIGIFGFGLQFLLTLGLVKDKTARATNMMYSSVVFGLVADWVIWNNIPIWSSWAGSAIVISSTVWAAMSKPESSREQVKYTAIESDEA